MDSEVNKNERHSIAFIKQVACMSAMECFGVVGMERLYAPDDIANMIKGDNMAKGVKININDDRLEIELYVIMEFGVKAAAVADNLIDTVKYNVEKQTGLKVKKVTVNITSVRV